MIRENDPVMLKEKTPCILILKGYMIESEDNLNFAFEDAEITW